MIFPMTRRMIRNAIPASNSLVTLTLRDLVESGFCLWDHDNPFPIWEEAHRTELEQKIVNHYAFRQIGFETPGRFKFELNNRLREIMPYYIKIWKTTQYKYNPIENYNMEEGSTDKVKNESKDTHDAKSRFSDTPQAEISNLDKYLTSATLEDGSASSKGEGRTDHSAWRHGNIGVTTTQQMIEQERNVTIDVDIKIIDELSDLFLGVY